MTEALNEAWLERSKLWREGAKLRAEGYTLLIEGDQLRDDADNGWGEAVIACHGNIALEWRWNVASNDYDCILESGEVFSIISQDTPAQEKA